MAGSISKRWGTLTWHCWCFGVTNMGSKALPWGWGHQGRVKAISRTNVRSGFPHPSLHHPEFPQLLPPPDLPGKVQRLEKRLFNVQWGGAVGSEKE